MLFRSLLTVLTNSALFLTIREMNQLEKLANLYVDEVVRLHGVLLTIVSDRDPRFTSKFWHVLLGEFE